MPLCNGRKPTALQLGQLKAITHSHTKTVHLNFPYQMTVFAFPGIKTMSAVSHGCDTKNLNLIGR